MKKEKTLIEKIEEAFICKECNGFGEVKIPYTDADGNTSLTDTETCENCLGDGEEKDIDVIIERVYEILDEESEKLANGDVSPENTEELKKYLGLIK